MLALPAKQAPTPKTGDHYGFRATGNVAKLGAPNGDHDGFYARYTAGPPKGHRLFCR